MTGDRWAKFDPGHIYVTAKAEKVLKSAGASIDTYLERHVHGDWGNVSIHRRRKNEDRAQRGGVIRSYYRTAKDELLIVHTLTENNLTLIFAGNDTIPRRWR